MKVVERIFEDRILQLTKQNVESVLVCACTFYVVFDCTLPLSLLCQLFST